MICTNDILKQDIAEQKELARVKRKLAREKADKYRWHNRHWIIRVVRGWFYF